MDMKNLKSGSVALLGIPSDVNSTFMRGPAQAPARIRESLHCGSMNLCAEQGMDLGQHTGFQDLGDLELSVSDPFRIVEESLSELVEGGIRVLSLGGDHAVTYPIMKAYGKCYKSLTLLHLDAHPDLYHVYEGNPISHACPFARIMEEGLAARLVQYGIRALNSHQREQAARFKVEIHEAGVGSESVLTGLEGPLYLSLDMDVLDPAFAPGVSHHEPGGLTTREVIRLIQTLPGPLVGADLVELNPTRDPSGITAMAAAKLVKEIAARMMEP